MCRLRVRASRNVPLRVALLRLDFLARPASLCRRCSTGPRCRSLPLAYSAPRLSSRSGILPATGVSVAFSYSVWKSGFSSRSDSVHGHRFSRDFTATCFVLSVSSSRSQIVPPVRLSLCSFLFLLPVSSATGQSRVGLALRAPRSRILLALQYSGSAREPLSRPRLITSSKQGVPAQAAVFRFLCRSRISVCKGSKNLYWL
jgi:hypothetical protein